MYNFLYFLMIIPILLCSQITTLEIFFEQKSDIIIYKDSQIIELNIEQKQEFEDLFNNAFENAKQMPAYAVCLNEMVKEEIKHGYWVKFIYSETQIKNEMPFDELLIHIEQDSSGVNILRGNNGIFEGRCYYFDLENNLNDVYEFINQLKPDTSKEIELELENQETSDVFLEKDEELENKDKNDKNSTQNK